MATFLLDAAAIPVAIVKAGRKRTSVAPVEIGPL
jgi:hypothetical protein